uniref:Uncharacterized protein n=1 Tax=Sphenodon punctatus TaxID=8508 RepID=A0A8D0GRQ4_SPHPU
MESAVSVLSPSSWERRRAWAKQSRLWHSVAVEEEGEAETVAQDTPELQSTHLDDVFLQGSSSNKIESWLQECGFALNLLPEEICAPATHGACSNATSFEDDLTLGAEGTGQWELWAI